MRTYLATRRDGSFKYTALFGPRLTKVYERAVAKANELAVEMTGMSSGLVTSLSLEGREHTVKVGAGTEAADLCSCRRPAATGMLCSHAIAVLKGMAESDSEDGGAGVALAPADDPQHPLFYTDPRLTAASSRAVYSAAGECRLPGTTGGWTTEAKADGLKPPQWLLDNLRDSDGDADAHNGHDVGAGAGAGGGAGGGGDGEDPAAGRAAMPARYRAGRGRRVRGRGRHPSRGEDALQRLEVRLSQQAPRPARRPVRCGNCGGEGHNRRSCVQEGGGRYQAPQPAVDNDGDVVHEGAAADEADARDDDAPMDADDGE